jgi:hypothetical protein
MQITKDMVKRAWHFMCDKHKTRGVEKDHSTASEALAAALAIMGIVDKDEFLHRYATTLGHTIYLPFEVGETSDWTLLEQLAVCAHEHVHVRQFHKNDFITHYCLSSAKRALYEAEAYRATMEVYHWATGTCPSPKNIANVLKDYMCNKDDIRNARLYLDKSLDVVEKGAIISPEVQEICGVFLPPSPATSSPSA